MNLDGGLWKVTLKVKGTLVVMYLYLWAANDKVQRGLGLVVEARERARAKR